MSDHEHAAESHGHVNYLVIFVALCVFTALSILFDVVDLSQTMKTALVLAVATAKALCVMMFFMHLKFEGNWKYLILAPTTILAIGLMVALGPDQAFHYYTPTAPQMKAVPRAADQQHDVDMHAELPTQHTEGVPATVQ
jgi:cytochrome c oxidase subunit IV